MKVPLKNATALRTTSLFLKCRISLPSVDHCGLSAAVFSRNLDQARAVASRQQAGTISIKDSSLTALVHGGTKQSFKLSGPGGSRMEPPSMARR
jgi:succinate-semialdehyde dehydrogenase / glutarate-semialdehyde dehydrogenase